MIAPQELEDGSELVSAGKQARQKQVYYDPVIETGQNRVAIIHITTRTTTYTQTCSAFAATQRERRVHCSLNAHK
ncbi:hypothetical protein [Undibacterium sp.]|uniref:hypothetical protein n=1 Tax=Undibacterium sp. TaxID=1914977 RepID=UPI00374D5A30